MVVSITIKANSDKVKLIVISTTCIWTNKRKFTTYDQMFIGSTKSKYLNFIGICI